MSALRIPLLAVFNHPPGLFELIPEMADRALVTLRHL
jgi:hypothetical protein